MTSSIISAAIAVHKELGPGLLESVYERCLAVELRNRGHSVQTQVPVQVVYRGELIHDEAFRMDVLADETAIVEVKSCVELSPVFSKQLLTYLRLAGKPVGLLINFNEMLLKNGIERVINGFLD